MKKTLLTGILGYLFLSSSNAQTTKNHEFQLAKKLYLEQRWSQLTSLHRVYEALNPENQSSESVIKRNLILAVLNTYQNNFGQSQEKLEQARKLILDLKNTNSKTYSDWFTALELVEHDLKSIVQKNKVDQ